MASEGDKTHFTSVFRVTSPTQAQHRRGVIRRNRRVVSCVPCRTRKLKCDRQQPCSSCVKRHDEDACLFFITKSGNGSGSGSGSGQQGDANSGSTTTSHERGPPVQKDKMRAKLKMLEDLVCGIANTRASDSLPTATSAGSAPGPPQQPRPPQRHYSAVLDSIRDLQGYVDADFATTNPPTPPPGHASDPEPRETQDLEEILAYLPPRAECDTILASYFQQIYLIPAVCHAGQFQRIYEQFWQRPATTSPLWVSMLFSLLSTSFYQQVSKATSANAARTVDLKKRVADCTAMAYRCLLAGNHLRGGPFSVEATLLFAMHLVLQKRESDPRCWHMVGIAVRLAQRAGYHRDSKWLSRGGRESSLSPFEVEMRRRTWTHLEYFDVFFSFQLGIPPIINVDLVDTALPSHLRDEDFNEKSAVLPPSRPPTELTPLLVTIFLGKQIKLLHRVVQQAIALKQPAYTEVTSLHDDLAILHKETPPGLRWRPIRESGLTDIIDLIMRRILCETMYLKSLCILNRRYLTFGRQNKVYDRSRKACTDASLALLQIQQEFDENSGEGGRLYERRYLLTNLGYHDFLLAAMCLCLDLTIGTSDGKVNDYELKVEALKRAHTIWRKMADQSSEAAHASQVLDQILSKVSSPDHGQITDANQRREHPAPTAASTGASGSEVREANANASQPATAADPCLSALRMASSRSQFWEFGIWDDIDDQVSRGASSSSGVTAGPDIDWHQIDSFIFGRKAEPGSFGAPAPSTEHNSENPHDDPRMNWPYPSWNDRVDDQFGGKAPSPRSWTTAESTLTGLGPASSTSGFK